MSVDNFTHVALINGDSVIVRKIDDLSPENKVALVARLQPAPATGAASLSAVNQYLGAPTRPASNVLRRKTRKLYKKL